MRDGLSVFLFIAALAALTYFVFPGHTYLQQDTQIYVPMLEKLDDPSLFAHELLTSRPHLSWTVYDEVAIALRKTGLGFHAILALQQVLFRAIGICGVYLIGTSMGFTRRLAMFIAALFSLGATISGPQVLTIEYEPVPRGFALPLVFCAIGLCLHKRWLAPSFVATVALLYQAPTTAPFWIVYGALLWRARQWKPALLPAAGLAFLAALSKLQPGVVLAQPLFSVVSADVAQMQRLRAAYNWVSLWPAQVWIHHGVLCGIAVLAMWRVRHRLAERHYLVFGGLLIAACLSVPFSWATLEGLRWSVMPQFQPARAVLFITALAVILASAAGIETAFGGKYAEAFAWFLVPFAVPVHQLLTPPYTVKDAVLIAGLASTAVAATVVHIVAPRRAWAALAMAGLLAFLVPPLVGRVRNYPALWNKEIVELASWARASTPKDAVFLFARAGKDLHPGIFRAEARRAVYVDWKAGGQVNYFEDLAREWWKRWRESMLHDLDDAELSRRGISFVVVELKDARPGQAPLYSNAVYAVYRVGRNSTEAICRTRTRVPDGCPSPSGRTARQPPPGTRRG